MQRAGQVPDFDQDVAHENMLQQYLIERTL